MSNEPAPPREGDVYRAEVSLVDVRALHGDKDYHGALKANETIKYEELTEAERAALPTMLARGFWTRVTNVAPAETPKAAKPKKEGEAD